jgi:hypothetical protein
MTLDVSFQGQLDWDISVGPCGCHKAFRTRFYNHFPLPYYICVMHRMGIMCGLLLVGSWPCFALEIFRPKYGVPELVEAGGTFRVEVTAAAGLSSAGWSVAVANDLRTWTNCVVQQAQYGQVVYNNSLSGYALTVQPPADLRPRFLR